jgi:hypothetical protein
MRRCEQIERGDEAGIQGQGKVVSGVPQTKSNQIKPNQSKSNQFIFGFELLQMARFVAVKSIYWLLSRVFLQMRVVGVFVSGRWGKCGGIEWRISRIIAPFLHNCNLCHEDLVAMIAPS